MPVVPKVSGREACFINLNPNSPQLRVARSVLLRLCGNE